MTGVIMARLVAGLHNKWPEILACYFLQKVINCYILTFSCVAFDYFVSICSVALLSLLSVSEFWSCFVHVS